MTPGVTRMAIYTIRAAADAVRVLMKTSTQSSRWVRKTNLRAAEQSE